MRPRHAARGADSTQGLASPHHLTFFNRNLTHVAVHGHITLTMIDDDRVAVKKIIARCGHDTVPRRFDRGATGSGDIHSLVGRSWLIVEETPQAETGAARSIDRRRQGDSVDGYLAKIIQGPVNDLALATDAIKLCLIRCHVTLVLYRQALFGIGVVGHRNAHLNAIYPHTYLAWLRVQRNAYHGVPAIECLYHQCRLAAVANVGFGELRRTDIHDCDAAGTRRVLGRC